MHYWRLNGEPDAAVSQTGRGHRLFWEGFVVSATNPKSLAFYAAFFPQFIRVGADITEQLLILCVTFFVIASILTAGYAVLAGNVRRYVTGAATEKTASDLKTRGGGDCSPCSRYGAATGPLRGGYGKKTAKSSALGRLSFNLPFSVSGKRQARMSMVR